MRNIVIIPTYNEKENIETLVPVIFSLPVDFHILVVDDNSPDGTSEAVKKLQTAHPGLHLLERPGKSGLGSAYIAGFEWAISRGYDYIFEMDADFSHNPEDLVRLHGKCRDENAGLVIGSRYISGVNVVNWPLARVLMSYFASVYVRIITGMKIHDTTAGFKCYSRKALEDILSYRINSVGYCFQIEMKFIAWKLGYKIIEIPIIFTDRRAGTSKMSGGIFNEAFWGVLRMKLRSYIISYRKRQENEP